MAAQHFGVKPDLLACAKGMASGLPMGAVLMTETVAEGLRPGMLGSTFGGGPVACAALVATLDVIRKEGLVARAARLGQRIQAEALGGVVTAIRGEGLLLGLDAGPHAAALKAHLLAQRILVGGSHDPGILRLMPPLTLQDRSLDALLQTLATFDPALSATGA